MTMFPSLVSVAPAHQGLIPEDVQRVQDLRDRSVSANTRASYSYTRPSFERWTQARAVLAPPASPALVTTTLSEERLPMRNVGIFEAFHRPAVIRPATPHRCWLIHTFWSVIEIFYLATRPSPFDILRS